MGKLHSLFFKTNFKYLHFWRPQLGPIKLKKKFIIFAPSLILFEKPRTNFSLVMQRFKKIGRQKETSPQIVLFLY